MSATVVQNRQILLKDYITDFPRESDFIFSSSHVTLDLSELLKTRDSELDKVVVLKNLHLSCDPYMRGRMVNYHGSYIPPFAPGSVIQGFGVAKVVLSNHPDFQEGDLVSGFTGWEEYTVLWNDIKLSKIKDKDVPLSYYLGVLGLAMLVDVVYYFCFLLIGK